MSNLDDLVTELELIVTAIDDSSLQDALVRLDGVLNKLDAYQAPRTTFRPKAEPQPTHTSRVVPLRKRPALRPRVARRASA